MNRKGCAKNIEKKKARNILRKVVNWEGKAVGNRYVRKTVKNMYVDKKCV
jgi:hypothetical protein